MKLPRSLRNVISLIVVGFTAVSVAAVAEEPATPSTDEGASLLEQTPSGIQSPAVPPKANSKLLLEQELEGLPGYVVQVVLIEGPPGWVGGRHYHPGHLFGFILEGSYEFNFDNMTSRTVGPGEVFYETPNTVMRSRNGSSTEWVKDVVFHLKRKEDPPAVSVPD